MTNTTNEVLNGEFHDEQGDKELSCRPALTRFAEDAADEIQRFRSEGYDDRRDLLNGLHKLIFYSLGRIDHDWYAKVARQRVVLAVLITGEEREYWNTQDISRDEAQEERRRIAAKFVRPAMRAAFRDLRGDVDEHVGEEHDFVDPSELHNFAARPVLEELYGRQQTILSEFLDGFESRTEIDRWADRLDLATYGEHEAIIDNWDMEITTNPVEEQVLLGEIEQAARERELQAATILLPAFNRAVPIVLDRSKELPEEQPQTDTFDSKPV